jgi:hypothetical protein
LEEARKNDTINMCEYYYGSPGDNCTNEGSMMTMPAILGLAMIIHPVTPIRPIPVEVEAFGDDGATQRLEDALGTAFAASPRFRTSMPPEAGKPLVVTIPTNVDWESVGGRDKILYHVKFSGRKGLRLRSSRGWCWEDEVRVCANQVVVDALRAVAR